MNTKKSIPCITLAGTVFEVDINRQQLVERDNLDNTISFIRDMEDRGTHYWLDYDLQTKNALATKLDFYTENWKAIAVPKLIELDPEGMSEKYGYPVEELQKMTDFEVIVNQDLLSKRRSGLLPEITIADQIYRVDVAQKELRPTGPDAPAIYLTKLDLDQGENAYRFYYDTASRTATSIDPGLARLPENTVRLDIPNLQGLDPVAFACKFNRNERALLRQYPIKMAHKAKITPLSETGLPYRIQQNLKKRERQLRQQNSRHRLKF